ncbi:hypothetical protein V498_04619 [Pseudogymnoascus sp. VKM F-4517 (FW-2822)]|nr:hypothetical protein V498_04619 [Pseudogymnoascus sp. VKM F-4517 (FW-2822)]
MAPLESLIYLIKGLVRPMSAALESSILSKLPPELLTLIATFLPAASAASFALCCTPLYTLLAILYLKCKHGHHHFKMSEFLSLVERDLKDFIACYHCAKLHTIKPDKKHIKRASRCDSSVCSLMSRYIGYHFSYIVFQMAMKRHRQDADTRSLLRLLQSYEINAAGDMQSTSSTRIINGQLIARRRCILIVHRGNEGPFSKNWGVYICPHFGIICGRVILLENSKVGYRMFYKVGGEDVEAGPGATKCDCGAHVEKDNVSTTCSGLVQCDYCATEFRIDSMAVGRRKEGWAFIITWWKNLGKGQSVEDPLWSAHVTEGAKARTDFVAGSICAAFEGKREVELHSLLTKKELKQVLNFSC